MQKTLKADAGRAEAASSSHGLKNLIFRMHIKLDIRWNIPKKGDEQA